MLAIVAVAAIWIGISLYHGLRTDAGLHRQLLQLQAQSQSLGRQVQAQKEELGSAASAAYRVEIARSEGLSLPGEQVYAIENPVQAAGPGAIQQGAAEVGQTAQALVQQLLGLPSPTS